MLITAIMYDQDIEPSGGAALVIQDCDKSRALQVLAQLEGVLGFLSLLIGGSQSLDLARALGNPTGGLPYTIVFDRSGNPVMSRLGLVDEASLSATLQPLL